MKVIQPNLFCCLNTYGTLIMSRLTTKEKQNMKHKAVCYRRKVYQENTTSNNPNIPYNQEVYSSNGILIKM